MVTIARKPLLVLNGLEIVPDYAIGYDVDRDGNPVPGAQRPFYRPRPHRPRA
jgi:hypothetical protein